MVEHSREETCEHSYNKECHTTYVTTYTATQVKECDDNYLKSCYILYEKAALTVPVKLCKRPLVKDCSADQKGGEEVCQTIYQTECWTQQQTQEVLEDRGECRQVNQEICQNKTVGYSTTRECQQVPRSVCTLTKEQVVKQKPTTSCTKEPTTICAPAGCTLVEGPEECTEETRTLIQDKPVEDCSLEPREHCQFVTKLVPQLEPQEECLDVPKEVCTTSFSEEGRRVKQPVLRQWCYTPSKESGLA